MIAFIKHAEQSRGTLQRTAVPLLLSPYLCLKIVLFFLLLCFSADEIKDDFDTLGPDATLQAVGNGTGEFKHLFIVAVCDQRTFQAQRKVTF